MLWGLLALAGWFLVLLPAYLVVDQGPAMVHALFGPEEPRTQSIADPDDPAMLGRIAPAAGGRSSN
jgi:hypothetical protein